MNTYPDIAVVLVTSHGTVKINPTTQQPYTFNVPENVSLTLLNAVTPGVCNFWDTDDTQHFTEYLLKKLKNEEEVEILKNDPDAFINSLVEILKGYDVKMLNELYENKKNKAKNKDYDVDEEQFIYHYDKSYTIYSYNEGDAVVNKEYSRNNKTEQNESAWNFKVLLINKFGVPDLIRELRGRNKQDKDDYISFEDIINFLKEDNVKHVIFLDLSCSNFVDVEPSPQTSLSSIDEDDEEKEDDSEDTSSQFIQRMNKIQRNDRRTRRDILSSQSKSRKGGKRKYKKKFTRKRKHTKKRNKQRRKYKMTFK